MELDNKAGNASYADVEAYLHTLRAQQRAEKRLYPASGPVSGQISGSATRAFPFRGPQRCNARRVPLPKETRPEQELRTRVQRRGRATPF
jgi:hypothetical protein